MDGWNTHGHYKRTQSTIISKKIADSAPGIIYTFQITHDGKYRFPYVSDKCRQYYGASPEAIKHDASIIFDAVHEDDKLSLIQSIESSYNSQSDWTFEYRIHDQNDQVRWLYGNASFEIDEDGLSTWHGMIIDITDKKELESKLIELSTIDELTGIYNRRETINKLQEVQHTSWRYSREYCVVLIDLDNFKNINDTLGHKAGDEALSGFASILKTRLRKTDIFGRFGGEEFVVIMPETSQIDGQRICETLLNDIEHLTLQSDTLGKLKLSFSAGITMISGEDNDTSEILSRADKAMYQAKAAGKGQVVLDEIA